MSEGRCINCYTATVTGLRVLCDKCLQKTGRLDPNPVLVRAVQKMHPAEWARIRPACRWAAPSVDLDTQAAHIVMTCVKAKASGVLA